MMKLWSRVCFLVLVISRTSRGQTVTMTTAHSDEATGTNSSMKAFDESANQTEAPATETPLHVTTDLSRTLAKHVTSNRTEEVSGSTVAPNTTSHTEAEADTKPDDVTTVSMTTGSPSAKPAAVSSSWGYVILVLIILVIVVLCVILYLLRRVSRTYSFDLQRPSPSHHNEPTGTFEPVHLDDLGVCRSHEAIDTRRVLTSSFCFIFSDRPVPKDEIHADDLSPPPVANSTSPPSEEKAPNGETVTPPEQPDGSGVEPPPVGTSSPAAAEEPADPASGASDGTHAFFDDVGKEQQNENNNNPCTTVGSSGPFVEINLDEPALCDQLLTSTAAPSSVLPFSPFSFSSSS
ncbi:uncharacterized protein LOC114868875 isoform X1 [Betta splendens]|uniref:Uncharacterized protein LOC114868875 isoform X1 n=1 Tax=Betta splendens TaxID=158456 RepID=A0A6P7P788_BETSP|nr:uncharacterized protein LOC114868875 isoform X1 [Betta splendens]